MTPIASTSGPIPRIKEALEQRDWFKAVVFSAIELERYGYKAIKKHMETKKRDYREDVLKNLSLPQIATILQAIEIIDNKEFKTIMDVNSERNNFVHRATREPKFGAEADKSYGALVNDAMRVLLERLNVVRVYVSRN